MPKPRDESEPTLTNQTTDRAALREALFAKYMLAEELLLEDNPLPVFIAAMVGRYPELTEEQALTLRRNSLSRWVREHRKFSKYARVAQMHRLRADACKARQAGDWMAVAALERLLAEVEGTFAPFKIDLDPMPLEVERNLTKEGTARIEAGEFWRDVWADPTARKPRPVEVN